jgi:hypothetical protein
MLRFMKKSLLETNPYLKDPKKREDAMARNIETSAAIEGIWVKRDAKTGRFVHSSTEYRVYQVDKLVGNAKSRLTGNKSVKATFHANGWNP